MIFDKVRIFELHLLRIIKQQP